MSGSVLLEETRRTSAVHETARKQDTEAYNLLCHDPEHIFRLPGVEAAFTPDTTVTCIDGRLHFGVRCAGSGILMGTDEERQQFFDNVFVGVKARRITSHEGCGAARFAYERAHREILPEDIQTEDVEAWAQERTQAIAEKCKCEYVGHVPVREMLSEHHEERAVYVVAAPVAFQPHLLEGGLGGFVVSHAFHQNPNTAEYEAVLSAVIAFGPHGLGRESFSESAPFLMVILGNPGDRTKIQEQRRSLQMSVQSAVGSGLLLKGDERRIKIVSTAVPADLVNAYPIGWVLPA